MSVQFVIVSAPRTGSTLLVRTLNTLSDIRCHGELLDGPVVRGFADGFDPEQASAEARQKRAARLLQTRDRDPVRFIQDALSSSYTATGFKALYRAMLDPRWKAVTDTLLSTGSIKFVQLDRRNELRRYVSEQILIQGGPIHSQAGGRAEQRITVHVDIEDFLRSQVAMAQQASDVSALLSGQAVMPISYEELSADTSGTTARVCQFLELPLPADNIQPALSKVGARDLSESVSNFQELLDSEHTREFALSD